MQFDDPLTAIAFSMHRGPGQLAVLLGSGVSRAAGILTGWDITIDLVSQIPGCPNASDDARVTWFQDKYGKAPSYSTVMELLGRSQADRRNILKGYVEPTADERERGLKQPTEAHRAIARMVARGYVRVIITTNFDRLMEVALEAEGITPDVIRHHTEIGGAMPYAHSKCVLLKLHGDYQSTRLLNTPEELSEYDPALLSYLARILDDFGLIACGWSAEYDAALVQSIKCCPNRRFHFYFMHIGQPEAAARDLIAARRGEPVQIASADRAFTEILERLLSLDRRSGQVTGDVQVLVETVKRFLSKPEYRIKLHDLLDSEAAKAKSLFGLDNFPLLSPGGTDFNAEFIRRVKEYEGGMERLLAAGAVIAYHGDAEQTQNLVAIYEALRPDENDGGTIMWLDMLNYPSLLSLVVPGAAAVASLNGHALRRLLVDCIYRDKYRSFSGRALGYLIPRVIPQDEGQLLRPRSNSKWKTPVHDHLAELTDQYMKFATERRVSDSYDKLMYVLSMHDLKLREDPEDWVGLARVWRYEYDWNNSPGAQVFNDIKKQGDAHPFITSGLFQSVAEVEELNIEYRKRVTVQARRMF